MDELEESYPEYEWAIEGNTAVFECTSSAFSAIRAGLSRMLKTKKVSLKMDYSSEFKLLILKDAQDSRVKPKLQ